jgi:hypothetical protein
MWRSLAKLAILTILSMASGSGWALETSQSISGGWSCTCSTKGACDSTQTPHGINCSTSSQGGCTGECQLEITTTGAHPVSPAQVPSKTGGPGGPPVQQQQK